MNRLSVLSLAVLTLSYVTPVLAMQSQYACDKVIYENTLNRVDRGVRVCLSDKAISFTLESRADGNEGIDIKLPVNSISYSQNGVANALTFYIDGNTHYMISSSDKNLRLLIMSENDISRSYRLSSPLVDDISPTLHKYGIRLNETNY